ncbi:MAG: ribonuclease III [Bacteroidales bacterium]|nr:ribonuclease III [Bacteroidales bacterium]MBR4198821.1 ribonuclease III [Bacteroidales bacterium]
MFLFNRHKGNEEFYNFFKNILGFTPRRTDIYQIAFIHKSKSVEVLKGRRINNERLEYLGDAVLSAIVADYLYKKYPYEGEGFLTIMRSKIVSRANLNKLAHKIGLTKLIQYNKEQQGIFKSIEGDAFEALVGAIYMEKGYNFTRKIIIDRVIRFHLDVDALSQQDWNYKSKLIDWGQKEKRKVSFEVVRTIFQGKQNASRKEYEVQVLLDGEPAEKAIEFSIKAAEQLAAEKTYKKLVENGTIPKTEG